jgi:hypothetical protein
MTISTNSAQHLARTVDDCIHQSELLGLTETTALLRMVKLDIVTRTNGISVEELDLFLFALETGARTAEYISTSEQPLQPR